MPEPIMYCRGFGAKLIDLHAVPGGYVCMTTRANASNREYKEELESVLQPMEQTGLWSRVTVLEEDLWEKAVSDQESGYIPGVVYLYKKSVGATHEQFNAMNQ